MSDFFGKLKSGAGKVAFEAEKMQRLSRAKGELDKVKSSIQALYMKLGEMYYTQRATMGVTGPAYDEICQSIVDLEQQVQSKNDEVQRINAEIYSPQAAQPAAQPTYGTSAPGSSPAPVQSAVQTAQAPAAATSKFCPNCGTEMPVATKFCPNCGTKV